MHMLRLFIFLFLGAGECPSVVCLCVASSPSLAGVLRRCSCMATASRQRQRRCCIPSCCCSNCNNQQCDMHRISPKQAKSKGRGRGRAQPVPAPAPPPPRAPPKINLSQLRRRVPPPNALPIHRVPCPAVLQVRISLEMQPTQRGLLLVISSSAPRPIAHPHLAWLVTRPPSR
jgi:hypothetical protein